MSDVSRGTPSAPESARRVFPSERLALAERYAAWLAGEGVVRGLIGPREVPRLWDRHLLNCAVLTDAFPTGSRTVADLGSGAGLPGIVVALRRPDLEVTLVEPLLRRATFLEEVGEDLGLRNVQVVRARAEDLHGQASFDVVTSRAVAPLPRLLEWSMPLVAARGRLVAMKGTRARQEVELAEPVLASWEALVLAVHEIGGGVLDVPTTAVEVSWAAPDRVGWPSRPGPGPRSPREAGRARGRRASARQGR